MLQTLSDRLHSTELRSAPPPGIQSLDSNVNLGDHDIGDSSAHNNEHVPRASAAEEGGGGIFSEIRKA